MMITSDCKEYVTRSGQKATIVAKQKTGPLAELEIGVSALDKRRFWVVKETGAVASSLEGFKDFDIVGPWVPEPSQRVSAAQLPVTFQHHMWLRLTEVLPELTKDLVQRLENLAKLEQVGTPLSPPVPVVHPHALNMLRYALDALTTDEPGQLWEGKYPHPGADAVNGWESFDDGTNPPGVAVCTWNPDAKYRRKPTQAQQIAEATGVDIAQVEKVLTHLDSEK